MSKNISKQEFANRLQPHVLGEAEHCGKSENRKSELVRGSP